MFIFHSASCGACGHKLSPAYSKVEEVGEVFYERTEHRCTNPRCNKDTSVIIEGRKPMERRGMVTIPKMFSPSTRPGRWAKAIKLIGRIFGK